MKKGNGVAIALFIVLVQKKVAISFKIGYTILVCGESREKCPLGYTGGLVLCDGAL